MHENLKVLNFEPRSGLVNISAIIWSVCRCSNVTCPEVRKLWIQKNRISMCLDLSLQDLPVFARHMVDWLSFQIWAGKAGCPWASRKCFNQIICGSASEIPTSSASVELFVTSFCFDDRQYIAPLPKVMYTPVWLLMSELCVANDASTNAVTLIGPFTSSVRHKSIVPARYPIPLCSLDLSSSVGACTLVVKKATSVKISGLVLLLR